MEQAETDKEIKMDKEQFEELLLNIMQIGQDLKNKLDNIEDAIKNNTNVIDNKSDDKDGMLNEDLYGIPLDSVHHPNNPDYTSNKKYFWNDELKMWRPK